MTRNRALPMMHDHDWERLARYVTGEASADEAAATRAWIDADDARQELSERLRSAWEAARHDQAGTDDAGGIWDSAAAWRQIDQRLLETPPGPSSEASMPAAPRLTMLAPRSRYRWAVGIAAAIGLVAIGGITMRIADNRESRAATQRAGVPINEVVTQRAQRAAVRLADGTRIVLDVDSRIRYPQSYGVSAREITLEGEAYFEVAHGTLPFVVRTRRGTVRDVGTRFVLSDYASGTTTGGTAGPQVVVTEGTVSFQPAPTPGAPVGDSVMLTAGMLGRITADGKVKVERDVDVADYVAWTEGRLVFAETPLREVVHRLSRWYDIDVRLGDAALANVPCTLSVTNENPEYVLRVLAAAADARLERRGQAYVFRSRTTNHN